MRKAETTEQNKTFWEIVESQDLYRDVLVPAIAAEDKVVRSTIAFTESNRMPNDKAALQDIHMCLEGYIVHKYGLPLELSDLVFKLCGDMLWLGDFERGEA